MSGGGGPSVGHGRVVLLTVLALLSGCCALAYEVLYIRALTTLLGDMLYVHAALLSTFLVGIGLGAKLAHRFPRLLWAFEVLTGLYAVALPPVSRWLSQDPSMVRISNAPGLTILVTMAFVALPSLLIGFSIPLFSAYIKSRARERLAFQGVYAAYNLGALLSILAVEFFLVRRLGVSGSLALVGAVNIFNGIVLLLLREAPAAAPAAGRRRFPRRIVLALALASVASAAFQMFFLRLTYMVFGPQRENFAVSLAITLLGIFVGAWWVARSGVSFSTLLVAVPVFIGLSYSLHLPILDLQAALSRIARASEAAAVGVELLIGSLYALGPMVLFGATLPALMRAEREVAGESGHLLWVSSIANAAGYLAYVLVGHPWLDSGVVLLLLCAMALLASLLGADWRWSRMQGGLAVAGVVLLALLAFRWNDRQFYLARWVDEIAPEDEVLVFKSGPESATLLRTPDTEWVSYNGHSSVVVKRNGVPRAPEILSGVVPALGAPRLERALVLGLGTGATGGAAARIFDHTDVVEINRAFLDMLPELSYINLDIEHNPRATIHVADGRSFLIGHEDDYDAIVNSIPAPTYYSASKIYTVEFYERVRAALRPDGVFCTWLAVHEFTEEGLNTVLAALGDAFAVCDLRMLTGGYYMATCSDRPPRSRRYSDLPADPLLTAELERALPRVDLDALLDDVHLSPDIFADGAPSVSRANTDDRPVLEFLLARKHRTTEDGLDPFLAFPRRFNVDPVRLSGLDGRGALLRRAMTFRRMNSAFYELAFLPLLEKDTDVGSR